MRYKRYLIIGDFMDNFSQLLGKELIKLRNSLGKSLSQMSKEMGINKSNLSRYERGKTIPSVKFLHKIIETYSLEIRMMQDNDQNLLINFLQSNNEIEFINEVPEDNFIEFDIVGEIAAGMPMESAYSEPAGKVKIPSTFVNGVPENFLVFKVNGKSMQPDVNDGDIIFIKKSNSWNNLSSKIVAVRINGEITLKKLKLDAKKKLIILLPLNPDFKTIIVNPEENDDISIIGELRSIIRQNVN
jgi:SOS-response transcriptional repressor LexA